MRTALTIIITLLVAIAPFSVAAAKSESDTKLVNVLVTIAGDPACTFLPENYVSMKTPVLDNVFKTAAENTEKSVEQFISSSCESMIARLDQTYGLLMKGFACAIKEINLKKLRKVPGVIKVEKIPDYKLFDVDTHADSPAVTKSKDAWSLKDPQGRPVTGTGQVIGIIDTGLDWRHPALGGKYGSGGKVINGVDYSTGKGIEIDPQTHGTQVAGAAAGNGKYKGSAPDAKLIGYKVYPEVEGGGGTNVGANILKAVEQSVSMKCTVINLSLGSAGGSSGDEDANEPFRNASKAGVMICAAAGNNGARSDNKGFQVSSPSTIPPVLSCAATDDTRHLTITITAPETEKDSKFTGTPFDNPEIWPAGDYDVVDCGYGASEDFTGKDLTGKIALIKRGPIGQGAIRFKDKALKARDSGAVGCIIYNYSLTSFNGTMYSPDDKEKPPLIPSIGTTYTQGYRLKSLIDKGLRVSVGIGDPFGMITDFSSMGPSTDYKFKPEVAAPGLGVMCPVYMGVAPNLNDPPYNSFAGTSCATPVISGVAALVRQKNPYDTPQLIKCRLMSTANLLFNQSANEYIPLGLQGSGRVDAVKAMTTSYYFNPPSLALKSFTNTMNSQVKLFNLTKEKKQAKLSYWSIGRNTTCQMPETIELLPNGETDFDITITCDLDSIGVLEGLIFADIDGNRIHIPMIVVNGPGGVDRRMSDLRISSQKMDFNDPKTPSITFRINYGQFEENSPGRDVTSNFAAGRLDVFNSDGYVGSIMMDDAMQVGYYNIHWDGTDYLKRLFAPNGDYVIKAVGIDSLVDGDRMMIRNQSDPPTAPIKIANSPLLQMPSIKVKSIPKSPNFGEPFELRFYTSQFSKVTSVSFSLRWDPIFFSIDKMVDDTAFGRQRDGVHVTPNIDNAKGVASVDISLDKDLNDSTSDFLCSFRCIPLQDGKCDYSLTNLAVQTIDGGISPKEYSDFLVITNTYSQYDLNNDTVVNELDADLLRKFMGYTILDPQYKEYLDFNADGKIDSTDMLMLAKMIGFQKSPP